VRRCETLLWALTWSATTTSGSAVSDTKELTFLVGD
jgi:hypothetical protein